MNVVPLHLKNPQKGKNHRPCSLVAVSDKGNTVYGTAALLVVTKRAGGVDSYETEMQPKERKSLCGASSVATRNLDDSAWRTMIKTSTSVLVF